MRVLGYVLHCSMYEDFVIMFFSSCSLFLSVSYHCLPSLTIHFNQELSQSLFIHL